MKSRAFWPLMAVWILGLALVVWSELRRQRIAEIDAAPVVEVPR